MIDNAAILASVIQQYTGIPASRIVIPDGTFEAPKDKKVYVTIRPGVPKSIGISRKFDNANQRERISNTIMQEMIVEVCSRNEEAEQYYFEVSQATTSSLAEEAANLYGIKFFRPASITNLTAIEGVGSLRRYQIRFNISKVETKETAQAVYTQFPIGGINNE